MQALYTLYYVHSTLTVTGTEYWDQAGEGGHMMYTIQRTKDPTERPCRKIPFKADLEKHPQSWGATC